MKRIFTMLLVVATVIGIAGLPALGNPEIDKEETVEQSGDIAVDVTGALASTSEVEQVLNNWGDQKNDNTVATVAGDASAHQATVGAAIAGNSDSNLNCNNGGDGKGIAKIENTQANDEPQGGDGGDDNNDHSGNAGDGAAVNTASNSADASGTGGNGGSGCNNAAVSAVDSGDVTAVGGDADTDNTAVQTNSVTQTATANLVTDQTLDQTVDIDTDRISDIDEDLSIDFDISVPITDSQTGDIQVEKENSKTNI